MSFALPPSDSPEAGPRSLRSPADTLLHLLSRHPPQCPPRRSQLDLCRLPSNPSWAGEGTWGAPLRKWAEQVEEETSSRIFCFQESARYKTRPKGSSDTITFSGNFNDRTLISLGWLLCYLHWRCLLTFSCKPSPRSSPGIVSTILTVDTERTQREE